MMHAVWIIPLLLIINMLIMCKINNYLVKKEKKRNN